MGLIERSLNILVERRNKILRGEVNCIPSSLSRFRNDFVGVEQGKYYLVSGATKAAKTQIASKLFIYDPLFYAYEHPDKVHLKIFYFPLEETPENITLRFISHLLCKKSNREIRISPMDLKSTNENNPVSQEVIDLLKTEEYQSILKFFEENVMFFEDKNPTGIHKKVRAYMEKNGTIHKKTIHIKNKQTGNIEDIEVFDYYEPFDPKETVLVFTDHLSLLDTESGMTLRETINKYSEYMVDLRNKFNVSSVNVQQQGMDTTSLEAFKANKIRPTLAGLSDSKNPGKDCNMMLGITNPHSYEISSYLGYDISKLRGNVRFLEVVLNRDGNANGVMPLFFDGATCSFYEMPLPTESEGLQKIYAYLNKIRNTTVKTKVLLTFNKLFKHFKH